jgi:hypothetical protein
MVEIGKTNVRKSDTHDLCSQTDILQFKTKGLELPWKI